MPAGAATNRVLLAVLLGVVMVASSRGVRAEGAKADRAGTEVAAARGRVLAELRLHHIAAADAAVAIQPILSPDAVVTFPRRFDAGRGQVLHLSDRPENVERATKVVKILEAGAAAGGAARLGSIAGDGIPASGGPPGLREALEQDDAYRKVRDAVHELDVALAVPGVAGHNRVMVNMRSRRDERLRDLREATKRVRARLESEAGASRGATRLGATVIKAAPELGRRLKLPEGAGLVVEHVTPAGAGEAAGLLPRDVLYRLDGQMLVNVEQLDVVVGSLEPGKEAPLLLFRDGDPLRRTVTPPAAAVAGAARK